jgi:hypothetical protein
MILSAMFLSMNTTISPVDRGKIVTQVRTCNDVAARLQMRTCVTIRRLAAAISDKYPAELQVPEILAA